MRAAGWQLNRLVRHRAVDTVDERLRDRGWRAVLSLRLIPVVPFSALNYAAGASAVRLMPYTLATLAGLLPGTAAVVVLGDALAGHVSPMLVPGFGVHGGVGVGGPGPGGPPPPTRGASAWLPMTPPTPTSGGLPLPPAPPGPR